MNVIFQTQSKLQFPSWKFDQNLPISIKNVFQPIPFRRALARLPRTPCTLLPPKLLKIRQLKKNYRLFLSGFFRKFQFKSVYSKNGNNNLLITFFSTLFFYIINVRLWYISDYKIKKNRWVLQRNSYTTSIVKIIHNPTYKSSRAARWSTSVLYGQPVYSPYGVKRD